MIFLLIVDDEPTIVEGLAQQLQDMDTEELIVLKAYSGHHALEILNYTQVDVLLCDVCMPGMSGLELMEQVERLWPLCRMLFLTGHDRFEYIHKAANSAMFCGYFLKNDGDKKLFEALERIFSDIHQGDENRQLVENTQKQLKRLSPIVKNAYIQRLIYGSADNALSPVIGAQEPLYSEMNVTLAIDLDRPVLAVLGRYNGPLPYAASYGAIALLSEAMLMNMDSDIVFEQAVLHQTNLLWLFQSNHENCNTEIFIQRIRALLKSAQTVAHERHGVDCDFAIAWRTDSIGQAGKYVNALQSMLDSISPKARGMMILDADWMSNFSFLDVGENLEGYFLQSLETLEKHLLSAQKNEFIQSFNELSQKLGAANWTFKRRINLLQTLLNSSHRLKVYEDIKDYLTSELLSMESFNGDMLEVWSQALCRLGTGICEASYRSSEQNTARVIGAINAFISKNISNHDLSLVMLGDMSGFNPTYLSRYYKQQTGVNIWDYISNLRLEKACELLKQGDVPIHEIGLRIGFDSPSYFSGFFRRKMGVSPKQYQDMSRSV